MTIKAWRSRITRNDWEKNPNDKRKARKNLRGGEGGFTQNIGPCMSYLKHLNLHHVKAKAGH